MRRKSLYLALINLAGLMLLLFALLLYAFWLQALVSTAVYGTPQRSATGYNAKRLNMLLAVLEKRAGFKLGAKDVFLNVTGGITVDDPAIDLAVVAAELSSNIDITIDRSM